MRDVCVVGLGLIGGSVLRAAVAAGRVAWGATASVQDAEAARADGFDVLDLGAALSLARERDALVVVAVPLPAVEEVLRRVPAGVRLTDVVSVKGPVAEVVARVAPGARYVGGHPMAGTAESGWAAGRADLFHDAAWVVTAEDGTDLDVLTDVVGLALDARAHVVPATAAEHDAAVARISHLPHVLAAVLASVGADGGPLALALAAGSFGDGTRVAGSRPEGVRAMCEGNRAALLDAVDDALGRLGAARGSLASTGGLAKTIDAGHRARVALQEVRHADRADVTIDLTSPEALAALRALGSRGGRVVGLTGSTVLARTS
ncbi:prephenate dehydrogenase [Saccharothrix australiensis]|uniref:Prephenate dehydrogenase n=1 Tax=Saccharothrix australiensis TaxID=2072 RepID=A0A495VRQ1_9PSEU|nr:prephenate dehydrogenase [Saccharothrix australiensis]RKT52046.1 prephenate dehydrogenase [Saccharothrix australiensis]